MYFPQPKRKILLPRFQMQTSKLRSKDYLCECKNQSLRWFQASIFLDEFQEHSVALSRKSMSNTFSLPRLISKTLSQSWIIPTNVSRGLTRQLSGITNRGSSFRCKIKSNKHPLKDQANKLEYLIMRTLFSWSLDHWSSTLLLLRWMLPLNQTTLNVSVQPQSLEPTVNFRTRM